MPLTAKTRDTVRNKFTQAFRGDGSIDTGYRPGATMTPRVAVAEVNVSDEGTITAGTVLGTGVTLPPRSVITRTSVHVLSTPNSSASLSIGFSAVNDNDLVASAATNAAPWSTTGFKAGAVAAESSWVQVGASGAEILMTTSGSVALTQGRIVVYVHYLPGAA